MKTIKVEIPSEYVEFHKILVEMAKAGIVDQHPTEEDQWHVTPKGIVWMRLLDVFADVQREVVTAIAEALVDKEGVTLRPNSL